MTNRLPYGYFEHTPLSGPAELLDEREDIDDPLADEKALVFFGEHGSTSSTDGQWYGWRYSFQGAPDWLGSDDLDGHEPDECMQVLSYGFSDKPSPYGWRQVYSYRAGEKECPWCGPGTGEDNEGRTELDRRPECKLCEGDGYLYEGEDCEILVFAPGIVYGSGMVGCLYDNGPNFTTSLEDAIEGLRFTFDELNAPTWARVARDLREHGIHYFDRRLRPFVGADYCEVTEA